IGEFLTTTWPLMSADQERSLPYGDARNFSSMLLALARPTECMGINTTPLQSAGKLLLHRDLFSNSLLTDAEYAQVLLLANELFRVMRDEWNWQARDLWDVQGFIWATCRNEQSASDGRKNQTTAVDGNLPMNLILYGPPGTGKTYETAAVAV